MSKEPVAVCRGCGRRVVNPNDLYCLVDTYLVDRIVDYAPSGRYVHERSIESYHRPSWWRRWLAKITGKVDHCGPVELDWI